MTEHEEKLQNFIEIVCGHVKNRDAHTLIREDLYAHFEEAYLDELEQGKTEEDAADVALVRLGNAAELGRAFQQTYRTRMDWLTVGFVVGLALLGILMASEISTTSLGSYVPFSSTRVLVGVGFGVVVGALLYYLSGHQLWRLAPHTLTLTICLMMATDMIGMPRNGQKMLFGVNFFEICPYLLAFGAAYILSQPKWLRAWRMGILVAGIVFVGLLFHAGNSNANLLLTLIMLGVTAITAKVPARLLASGTVAMVLAGILYVLHYPWIKWRFIGAFEAQTHTKTAGFYNYQTQQLVNNAGWFGHGIGHAHFIIDYQHSVLVFAEFISAFGWLGGILFASVVMVALIHLYRQIQRVRMTYGKVLASGLVAIVSIQLVYPMLMGLGTFPIVGLSMPLLGGTITSSALALAAIGCTLGVVRRKQLFKDIEH